MTSVAPCRRSCPQQTAPHHTITRGDQKPSEVCAGELAMPVLCRILLEGVPRWLKGEEAVITQVRHLPRAGNPAFA